MSWNLAASVLDAASCFISGFSGRCITVVQLHTIQHTVTHVNACTRHREFGIKLEKDKVDEHKL